MQKNDIYEVLITDMNNLGNGIGRIDNLVTFVPHGVTGDRLSVKIIKLTSSYAVARIESIIEASPMRITEDCSVHGRCGGCVYRHISYDYEKIIKRDYVKSVFMKEGLPEITVSDTVSDGLICGYRNKAQYPLTSDYRAGFYASRSHDVIPCDCCALQPPVFADICNDVCGFLKSKAVPVYNEQTRKGLVRHIYIRYAKGSGELMLCLVLSKRKFSYKDELVKLISGRYPSVVSIVLNYNLEDTNVILGNEEELIFGKPYIEDIFCDMRFRISAMSFYQVNHDMAEILYKKVYALADIRESDKLADVYCGAGTIGLFLAKNAKPKTLVGVEIIPDAVKNAYVNASLNGVDNAEFVCSDANNHILNGSDVVIVDPPRKGCSDELIKRLAEISPRTIVYVSCECSTLARDARKLISSGYMMQEVCPVDLFPRTGHVECVTKFVKQN